MIAFAILLADFEVVKNMSNRFHGKQAQLHTSDLLMGAGLLAIVCLAAWGLSRLTRKGDDQPHLHSARNLFRELCRAHHIDRAGRALLQKVARAQNLSPASLFLDPDGWQPERLDEQCAPQRDQCRALHERLFAIVAEAEAAEAQAGEADAADLDATEAEATPDSGETATA
ncbi:MAG TPA: hypothetical protein VHY20_10540 [Pirellulales bacterium]|jgi:hypothetical protein|nr:hypothetical protein [Pirellulales bacterium]